MFSLGSRSRVKLTGHPQEWGLKEISQVLNRLNHRRAEDRKAVQGYLQELEAKIEIDCLSSPYTSLKEVLREEDTGKLPIQLKLDRELYEQMQTWLI